MPPYRGGIARFTASLAEELLDIGHDVKVISFRKQYPKLLYPGKTEKDYSQNISAVRTEFLFSPLNLEDWNETFKQIKCFQPDLVIVDYVLGASYLMAYSSVEQSWDKYKNPGSQCLSA